MPRYSYYGTAKDQNGKVIASATVSVYLAGTDTVASVYTASSGGTTVNSVTSGASTSSNPGYFIFWIDRADYAGTQQFKISISKTGFTTQSYDYISIFAPSEFAVLAGLADGQTLILGPNGLTNENYNNKTDLDYPPSKLNIIEGSQAIPTTINECPIYIERHTAAISGDANQYYDLIKGVSFFETGFALHHSVGQFEFRDRSGVNTKDRVAVTMAGGATAAGSGRGLFGGYVNIFDHADSDYPSLCGIEIDITCNRSGLSGDAWSGYGVSRTGLAVFSQGANQPHAAFVCGKAGGMGNWLTGLSIKDSDIILYGRTATDTAIDGAIKIRDSGNTKDIFTVNNIGRMYLNDDLMIAANVSNAGEIYFGQDGNDYISFIGTDYYFVFGGNLKTRIDSSGNAILWGVLYTGGASPLQVVGPRVIDARCDDAINSGDVTTDGVIDALRDAMIAHGLIAAA